MSKLKIALVGCGRISKNHFESLAYLKDDCELVGVCDAISERAEEAGREYGAAVYTDYDKMLKECECDIITITSPSGMHSEMTIKAAQAGKHVISEKPMAVDLKSADAMIKACEDAGVNLFIVKQNRLNPTMQLLKKAVTKNRFGKIYGVYINVFWQRPQSYYDMASWRGTHLMDGGAFMNQASHFVDALYWLLGDVTEVMAITDTLGRDIETEDTGSAIFRFKDGFIGNMNVTMLAYPKNIEGSITILGETGTVKIGGVAINNIQEWKFKDYDDDDAIIERSNYNPPNVYGYGHIPYYKNVIDSLRSGESPETDGNTGKKSLEIILAIYESSKTGKAIKLPLL